MPVPVWNVVLRVKGIVAAPAETGTAPIEIPIAVVVAPTMAKSRLSRIVPLLLRTAIFAGKGGTG
jgi:hypothetical protein